MQHNNIGTINGSENTTTTKDHTPTHQTQTQISLTIIRTFPKSTNNYSQIQSKLTAPLRNWTVPDICWWQFLTCPCVRIAVSMKLKGTATLWKLMHHLLVQGEFRKVLESFGTVGGGRKTLKCKWNLNKTLHNQPPAGSRWAWKGAGKLREGL